MRYLSSNSPAGKGHSAAMVRQSMTLVVIQMAKHGPASPVRLRGAQVLRCLTGLDNILGTS